MLKLVVFDLDGTLCDHAAAHQKAKARINVILQEARLPIERFWALYEGLEPQLLSQLGSGFLHQAEYMWRRFADICARLSSQTGVLPDAIGRIYHEETVLKCTLFSDVIPALEELSSRRMRVAILTNGVAVCQREKLRRTGLSEHVGFQSLYVSEDLGCSKPDTEAFAKVLSDHRLAPVEAVMVGDCPANDLEGATAAGMHAVLLSRVPAASANLAKHTIETLAALAETLSRIDEEEAGQTTPNVLPLTPNRSSREQPLIWN